MTKVYAAAEIIDQVAEEVAERITSEFGGFWTSEDLVDEIPAMIREAGARHAPTPEQTQGAVEAVALTQLLRSWNPQVDDRAVPLLLAEAGRRDARAYDIDDAENVIAFLLSHLDAFKKSEVGHG